MKTLTIDLSKCFECDEPMKDMHHVVPKSKGGNRTLPLCAKCHGLVHDKDFVKHRRLLIEGVERAKEEGKYKGRKKGSVQNDDKTLKRHSEIVKGLLSGHSYRHITSYTKSSSATIQKVKEILIKRNLIKPHVRNCVHEDNKEVKKENKTLLWLKNILRKKKF